MEKCPKCKNKMVSFRDESVSRKGVPYFVEGAVCSVCQSVYFTNAGPLTPRTPDEKPALAKAAFSVRETLSRFAGLFSAFRR